MLVLASPVSHQLEQLNTPNLQAEAAESLFGDTSIRPSPLTVASLIERGLTEDTIVGAAQSRGMSAPQMNIPLHDLEVSLPYLQLVSDTLADEYPDAVALFAGRDAEVLHDDYAIAHPDRAGHLLPASSDLWGSEGMEKLDLAARFLGQYGLTGEAVLGKQAKYVLVDSGFKGTIGIRLSNKVAELYGQSLLESGALAVRLVAAEEGAIGKTIIELPADVQENLIRYQRMFSGGDYYAWERGNTQGLAIGMQLMPRYHGAYGKLKLVGDRVVAVPVPQLSTDDLDVFIGWVNDSLVSPVAAAIVQYRVVKAAMERKVGPGMQERIKEMRRLGAVAVSLLTDRPA